MTAQPLRILLLNGPNLNLLGEREPGLYGSTTLADIEADFTARAATLGVQVDAVQSNHEGTLVDALHDAHRGADGVVFNPGAYGHTSVALRDAISAIAPPVVEVHLTNTAARERFRHHSHVSPVALGTITGLGAHGYVLALEALVNHLRD